LAVLGFHGQQPVVQEQEFVILIIVVEHYSLQDAFLINMVQFFNSLSESHDRLAVRGKFEIVQSAKSQWLVTPSEVLDEDFSLYLIMVHVGGVKQSNVSCLCVEFDHCLILGVEIQIYTRLASDGVYDCAGISTIFNEDPALFSFNKVPQPDLLLKSLRFDHQIALLLFRKCRLVSDHPSDLIYWQIGTFESSVLLSRLLIASDVIHGVFLENELTFNLPIRTVGHL